MKEKLLQILRAETTISLPKQGNGWVNLASFGIALKRQGVDYLMEGYDKLKTFIEAYNSIFELYKDNSVNPPIYYVREKHGQAHHRNTSKKDIRLYDWAYLGQLEARFYDLSKLALPEEWDFRLKGKDSNYEILSNYLQTTFSKLYNDSQILFSSNKRYAVFNTGLVNILYKPIYALFTQNDNPVNDRQWKLVDFCVEGENRAGKLLVSEFEKMPLPAHYFKNCQDLVYAIDADVPQLDHEHIILERLERYPYSVLRKYMPENVIPLQQIETLSEQDRNTYFEQFREALRNDSQTYNAFKEKIDSAVKLAVDRAHWNYKSAIPMYYPKKQRICLLLPLCLQNNNTADLALVVSRGKSGRYQGETIYLLDWAYKCARLVCRPDSDWLSPQVIHISNEDEDKGA